MSMVLFGAAAAGAALLVYLLIGPMFAGSGVLDLAIRYVGPLAAGALVGLILYMI